MIKPDGMDGKVFGGALESETSLRIAAKRREIRKARRLSMARYAIASSLILAIGFTGYSLVAGEDKKDAGAENNRVARANGPMRGSAGILTAVGGTSLKLVEPFRREDLVGVGFHQAENPQARRLDPLTAYVSDETTGSVAREYRKGKGPVFFIMNTRDRGTDSKSAMDIAVKTGSKIYSPVSGVITEVKEYYLYGQYLDYHLEIAPDGYPDIRVAIIHIDDLTIGVGQRVEASVTQIGVVRTIEGLDTQINEYLPHPSDHFHLQVNPTADEGAVAQ